MLAAVAALENDVVPVDLEDFGSHAGGAGIGVGPEIADACMDVGLAVRRDPHEPIEAGLASGVEGGANANANHLAATTLTGQLEFLLPLEAGGALLQRILEEGAGHRLLLLAVLAVGVRCVDEADREAVDPELA